MNLLKNIVRLISSAFCWLGGYCNHELAKCRPIQRTKASGVSATLFIPACIWGVGAWATTTMMGLPLHYGVISGILAGAMVMLMDRAMLVSMGSHRRSVLGIGFRCVLAFLGSLVFAHPLILFFAGGVITEELDRNRQAQLASIEAQYAPQLAAAKAPLAQSIASLRDSEKEAADLVSRILTDLTTTRESLQAMRAEADKESTGKRTGVEGFGQRYNKIKEDQIKPLELREAELQTQFQTAQEKLSAASAAKAKTITDGTKDDPAIGAILTEWETARSHVEKQEHLDLFSRFAALDRVLLARWQSGDYGLGMGYLIICGFLLLAELIPMLVKFSCSDDEYHTRVNADEFHTTQIYPRISAVTTTNRMQHEATLEELRWDNQVRMEQGDSYLDLANRVLARKEDALRMAEDTLRRIPGDALPEVRAFAERMAQRILDGYFAHADRIMAAAFPAPAAAGGPVNQSAPPSHASTGFTPQRQTMPSGFSIPVCACGSDSCTGQSSACQGGEPAPPFGFKI